MSRDDFADAVLGFNLYFLGLRPPRIIASTEEGVKRYDESVYLFPSATRSARAFSGGKGDYLSLFDFEQPWYVEPLLGVADKDREKLANRGRTQLDELIAEAESKGSRADPKYFCSRLEHHIEFANIVYSIGWGKSIRDPVDITWDDRCLLEARSPDEVVPFLKKVRAPMRRTPPATPAVTNWIRWRDSFGPTA